MATKFYKLPVKKVEKTTEDCALITFQVADEQKEEFAYKQGQYLTLRKEINGEDIRRSYSLCSSPLDNEWQVAVKKVEEGRFSTFANEQLKEGEILEVMPPDGRFFVEVDPFRARNYVAFAAGSGITPILSIIKTHLQTEPQSTFKLFYTNQAVSSIILKEEIEALKNIYLDRFEVFHFLTRERRSAELFNGRIDQEKLDVLFKHFINQHETNHYFICGPNEMIFLIRDYLLEKDIAAKKVHFELFNTENIVKKVRKEEIDPSKLSEISIIEGGKTITFSIPQQSTNILDAALENRADLPYACKGGMCCTCRAKVIEGKVDMLVNYGLEPEEIENGYVLTCQAIPLTEKVVVDFDTSSS